MVEMKSPETLIEQFCTAADQQAEATESGDYKRGNKAYQHIVEALKELEAHQATQLLRPLLQSSSVGVRVWTAGYLLSHNEPEAATTLEEIAEQKGIQALNAQMTLRQWRAGTLQPLF